MDTVRDEGLEGSSDEIIYSICCSEKRCLVTLDNVLRFPPEKTGGIADFLDRQYLSKFRLKFTNDERSIKMNIVQLTKLLISVLLIVNFGCSHTKSTRELGYYYIDEDDSEEDESKKTKQQANNRNEEKKSAASTSELGYYYIDEDEESEKTEQQIRKRDNEKIAASNVEHGKASYYADKFQGRPTASGKLYDRNKLTAAHRTHPFGTKCKVTNLANGKTVVVSVNDRGPHVKSRVIDLSYKAMSIIDGIRAGIINVKVEVIK